MIISTEDEMTESLSIKFASCLRKEMDQKGISNKNLALILNKKESYIDDLFSGNKIFNLKLLSEIESKLKINFNISLVSFVESKNINKEKIEAFEYSVSEFIKWKMDYNKNIYSSDELFNKQNDFSKIKVMKLLFFMTAINSNQNNLLKIFNKFYAMPYGHVEHDIHENISELKRYKISNYKLIIKKNFKENFDLSLSLKDEIDSSIKLLKEAHFGLINYKPFDLVDLSYKWRSWRVVYNTARLNDKFSGLIPHDLIRKEPKIFFI